MLRLDLQVLYRELGLPLNGDPSRRLTAAWGNNCRARKSGSSSSSSNNSKPSSGKEVLIKLKRHHALPGVILEWRKINMTLSKVCHRAL